MNPLTSIKSIAEAAAARAERLPMPAVHSMSCEFPEGCSCGATEHNRLGAILQRDRAERDRFAAALLLLAEEMETIRTNNACDNAAAASERAARALTGALARMKGEA